VGKGKLWILSTDVPWLVRYLADEIQTGGVAAPSGSALAGGCLAANCQTPWLSLRVKPQGGRMNMYEATFVGGPLDGKILSSNTQKFDQAKWDTIVATGDQWRCPGPLITSATPDDIRRACAHFLERACARELLKVMGHAFDVADPIADAKRAAAYEPH